MDGTFETMSVRNYYFNKGNINFWFKRILAKVIKLPVSNLTKLKTILQMVSIALLLSGDTGNKIINFQDYNAQTIGIILLWLSDINTHWL